MKKILKIITPDIIIKLIEISKIIEIQKIKIMKIIIIIRQAGAEVLPSSS